jgi:lysophospholipase L1-like esterase
MKRFVKTIFFFCSLLLTKLGLAQPFIEEIKAFRQQDSATAPPPKGILFIGSSSFTKWVDIQNYFPDYKIINRGFGGSTLPDVIRYADSIIFPYKPKQIIIYCGDNDLASSLTVTADTVFNRFRQLFKLIRNRDKKVHVTFVSIKPSPSRRQLMDSMKKTNMLIRNYLSKQARASFIDVFHPMLDTEGEPIKEIFTEDSLHMNKKGYAIWQKEIKPYLRK